MSEQLKLMVPPALMAKIREDAKANGVSRQAACMKWLSKSYKIKNEPPVEGRRKRMKELE